MLDQLGRHSLIDLDVEATGDLQIDSHHTVEDTGICLGDALTEALGEKKGIRRYGWALVPMEDALVQVALDLSGRPLLSYSVPVPAEAIGNYDPELTEEFFMALTRTAGMTLHIKLQDGKQLAPHRGGRLQGHGPGAGHCGRAGPPPGRRSSLDQGSSLKVGIVDYRRPTPTPRPKGAR